ncbi:protein adenylyltransferase SelO family protein [Facilibium subflavum]|uniref:protein adenylyltransferase SelO family protein n=1 Tax=Facilibium subflavum TaxID=2219058 RepID=UPI001AACBF87|nr:protein adenylyltransferase SelO family protein [Facilibium subflavum]
MKLQALFDYTIKRHFPQAVNHENPAVFMLNEVIKQQAQLIAQWSRVGFIHGVMNTDNMAICGQTIDYGPCAFMDTYHPDTVFSSIDSHGRYAFANQAVIAKWNIARLAESLLPLIDEDEGKAITIAQACLETFSVMHEQNWLQMMSSKLGFIQTSHDHHQLIDALLSIMQTYKLDYNKTFSDLAYEDTEQLCQIEAFNRWYHNWQQKIKQTKDHSFTLMQQNNPWIIPRNHRVEQALLAAENENYQPFFDLVKVLGQPFQKNVDLLLYHTPPKPGQWLEQTFCGT